MAAGGGGGRRRAAERVKLDTAYLCSGAPGYRVFMRLYVCVYIVMSGHPLHSSQSALSPLAVRVVAFFFIMVFEWFSFVIFLNSQLEL